MHATTTIAPLPSVSLSPESDDEISSQAARLRIITQIEPGHGVVPVFEEGAVLLRPGEVAVYREDRPFDLVPGLYCLERQRVKAMSPLPDTPRQIEREIVYVRSWTGRGRVEGPAWEFLSLRSKIIGGVRRYSPPEGPLYMWALGTLLLGPIIGIYSPNAIAGEC